MKKTLFIAPFLFMSIIIFGCKKIKKDCSEGTIIAFDELTYTYNSEGLPISWHNIGTNNSYQGSDEFTYSYTNDNFPSQIKKKFDGGYGWSDYSFSWNGDSCSLKKDYEGAGISQYCTLVINERGELLKSGDNTYHYNGGQLDSITNSIDSSKHYFFYDKDLLSRVDYYNSDILWTTTDYSYDKKDRLISKIISYSIGDRKISTAFSYKRNGYLEKISYEKLNFLPGQDVKMEAGITQTGCSYPKALDPIFVYKYGYYNFKDITFK